MPDCLRKHYGLGRCKACYKKLPKERKRDRELKQQARRGIFHPPRVRLSDEERKARQQAKSKRIWSDPVLRERAKDCVRQIKRGFSSALLAELRAWQHGRCAICPRLMEPGRGRHAECADHFETVNGAPVRNGSPESIKHPRGLLCSPCNKALGFYESSQRPAGLVIEPYERYLADTPVMQLERAK